ncbi:MAG: hypothetical protein ACYC2P_13585 [Paludibacteraceae bacterium]
MATLEEKYPPSTSCNCHICNNYCKRPGWWTVEQAEAAIKAGFSNRMMIEIAPELTFAVISPAFKGCEGKVALNIYAKYGCNFFKNNLCELYSTGFMPLECRFCHHDRIGLGTKCHSDLENSWNTEKGQKIVRRWCNITDNLRLLSLLRIRL